MASETLPAAPYCVPPAATPDERAAIIAARAREAMSDPSVRAVAESIRCTNCNETERAVAVLRRAQSTGFVADPPGCDAYRPVAITLRHGGDCDDLTPLVMALGELSGFRSRVAYLSQPGLPQDHVTGMLYVDGEWLWAEPSLKGARLGEHPYEAARRLGRYAPFGTGATGLIGGITDGIIANVLTVGLFAAVTYFAARAGARSARRNPAVTTRQAATALRASGARLPRGATLHGRARGMTEEREHRDVTRGDPVTTARIALAHLRERPDYYARLSEAMRANPFAGYRDFAECERAARRHGVRDAGAYCGTIKRRIEAAK